MIDFPSYVERRKQEPIRNSKRVVLQLRSDYESIEKE